MLEIYRVSPKQKKMIFSKLPIGLFKFIDANGKENIGYKFGTSHIIFEVTEINYNSSINADYRTIFEHIPNAEIIIEEK